MTTSKIGFGLLFLWVTACSTAMLAQQQRESTSPAQPSTARDRSDFTRLKEAGYPLNVNPEHVLAKDAPINDGDMVLGVVINGEARTYPVNYMNGPTNEVVNDILGGKAIAPTW